jgi:hypothetical protein
MTVFLLSAVSALGFDVRGCSIGSWIRTLPSQQAGCHQVSPMSTRPAYESAAGVASRFLTLPPVPVWPHLASLTILAAYQRGAIAASAARQGA